MKEKRRIILVIIAFSIIGFVLYGNTLGNGFIFDDYLQITENQYVTDFEVGDMLQKGIVAGAGKSDHFYRPIVSLSFAIDYWFWGDSLFAFHFTNILLHILSAILIYLIFLSLQSNKTVAGLTGLLFLIHPLQVESVTYISGRTDLMPIFFMLLSLFLFIPVLYRNDKKHIFYISSLVSFTLALFSKELAIIFPFLLLIIYFAFVKREWSMSNIRHILLKVLPFFAIILGYVVLRMNILPSTGSYPFYQDFFGRILSFFAALFLYSGIIIAPHNLRSRFDHEFPIATYGLEIVISIIILIAIFYFSIRSLKKDRNIFFGFSWFFVGLIPASGILIPLFSIIAERWLRLPSVGIFYLASLGVVNILGRIKDKILIKKLFIASLTLYLLFFAVVTIRTNELWKTPATYFQYLVRFYPDDWVVRTNLGIAYAEQKENDKALIEFKRAIELKPDVPDMYYNLGRLYSNQNQFDLAVEEYTWTIELDKNFIKAYQPLVQAHVNLGHYDVAITYLEQLRDLLPDSWKVYSLLGQAYVLKEDYSSAKENFEKAFELNPANPKLIDRLEAIERML